MLVPDDIINMFSVWCMLLPSQGTKSFGHYQPYQISKAELPYGQMKASAPQDANVLQVYRSR